MDPIYTEATLVIRTCLPTETDVEMDARYEDSETILTQLEMLIESIYQPGGQYHIPGYTVSLDRA